MPELKHGRILFIHGSLPGGAFICLLHTAHPRSHSSFRSCSAATPFNIKVSERDKHETYKIHRVIRHKQDDTKMRWDHLFSSDSSIRL